MSKQSLPSYRELVASGLDDTVGTRPERVAEHVVGRNRPLFEPLAHVLHRPMDANAHAQLADAFHAMGAALSEAVELRFATQLDPRRVPERLRLGRALLTLGLVSAARQELEIAAADSRDPVVQAEARSTLASAPQATWPGEAESSLSEFQPLSGSRASRANK